MTGWTFEWVPATVWHLELKWCLWDRGCWEIDRMRALLRSVLLISSLAVAAGYAVFLAAGDCPGTGLCCAGGRARRRRPLLRRRPLPLRRPPSKRPPSKPLPNRQPRGIDQRPEVGPPSPSNRCRKITPASSATATRTLSPETRPHLLVRQQDLASDIHWQRGSAATIATAAAPTWPNSRTIATIRPSSRWLRRPTSRRSAGGATPTSSTCGAIGRRRAPISWPSTGPAATGSV